MIKEILKSNVKFYIYTFLLVALNYGLSFLLTIFTSRYFVINWQLIPANLLFITVVFLNLILVFLQWLFFNRKFKQIVLEKSSIIRNLSLYIAIILLTIVYHYYYGKSNSFDIKNWSTFVTIILFIPILEELIYRGILVSFFSFEKKISFKIVLYISLLFTLTHIDTSSVNWLYLGYVFFNGLILLLIRLKNGLTASIITHIIINAIIVLMTYFLL